MTRLAQSGHSLRRKFCPLSDNSEQRSILARDGLSAYDPKRKFHHDSIAWMVDLTGAGHGWSDLLRYRN